MTSKAVIEAALRAWWQMDEGEKFIWELRTDDDPETLRFKESAYHDMAAAIEAALLTQSRENP